MDNPFSSISFPNLQQLFGYAINSIVNEGGLSIPCKLKYGTTNPIYCNNCEFDPVSQRSSSIYNGTGQRPFLENSVCPVCLGMGKVSTDKSEIIYMAVIFDSKYWLNWNSKTVNIPDGMVQTICGSDLLFKVKNANQIVFNGDEDNVYSRADEPQKSGLGNTDYIFTLWKRQ